MTIEMTEQSKMSLKMHRMHRAADELVSLMNGVKAISEFDVSVRLSTKRRRHDAALKTLVDLELQGIVSFDIHSGKDSTEPS
ncbi:MAG: hypothetical protein V3S69_00560 [Dehalococcoidales bacterium]